MNWLFLALYSLTVVFRLWYFRRRGWRAPLRNGERYFLEVEVPEGWHSSAEGRTWWRRYHASILAPHALEAIAFLAIAVWGRWSQLPLLSFVAPVFVACHTGMVIWWRRASGIDRQRPGRVAVDLSERRLRDYFSWPLEALLLLLAAGSWLALAGWGDEATRWRMPVTFTYTVAGLTVLKAAVARQGWTLPAERTGEYQRVQEVRRRQAAAVFDGMRVMLAAGLAGYGAVHSLGDLVPTGVVRWTALAASVAAWVWMMAIFVRGEQRMDRAGAGLPPAAMAVDWRRGWWSFGTFMAGLAALLFWPW
ncbi:MAG: hypothetical protein IT158_03670 [Bryobacterales bacterium]|nr:hypothetical protein [Bryobacterales bacterium]